MLNRGDLPVSELFVIFADKISRINIMKKYLSILSALFLLLGFTGPACAETDSSLAGKTLCVFGDSYVRNHKRPFAETWHCKGAAQLGMNYVNLGRNGSSVAFDRTKQGFGPEMTRRYVEIPDSADVIIVIAGHNDAGFIGEGADPKDVAKGVDTLCTLLKKAHPDAAIGWVLPWDVDRHGFKETIAIIRDACFRHDIPVFDAGREAGINVNCDAFRADYFQNRGVKDTAHLNEAGHNLVLPYGIAFISSLVGEGKR